MRKVLFVPLLLLGFLTGNPVKAEEPFVFKVTEDTPGLSYVSLWNYGTEGKADLIAEWNGLKPPIKLRLGQKLILREPPTLQPKEGAKLILEKWRKYLSRRARTQPETGTTESVAAPPATIEVKKQEYQAALSDLKEIEAEAEKSEELTAEGHFRKGEGLAKKKNYEGALENFRRAREIDDEYLPAWLQEIITLRKLKRNEEAAKVSEEFLDDHPEFKELPLFQEEAKP